MNPLLHSSRELAYAITHGKMLPVMNTFNDNRSCLVFTKCNDLCGLAICLWALATHTGCEDQIVEK